MPVPVLPMLEASAAELERAAASKGWNRTVERDLQHAVESVSGARSAAIRLAHWPSVGPVDVMLPSRVALELKWCRSGDTLANCAWDIAKLGCAVAEGEVDEALVAAGAPAVHWESEALGVELFAPRVYRGDDLARRYESWWRFWCRDVAARPIDLPCSIALADAGSVSIDFDGMPFVLRLARVEVIDRAWCVHVCPHRWRGERCPPRPWDPEGVGGRPA